MATCKYVSLVFVVCVFAVSTVSSQQVLLYNDANHPLILGTAPKQLSIFGGAAGDGTYEVEGNYMVVRSNPYMTTMDPSPLGTLDHVKWLAFVNQPFSIPKDGREIIFSLEGTSETFGTISNPFQLPSNDPRLAATAFNTVDLVTSLVADFFITNNKIYVLYERLPFSRTAGNVYASFTYLIPVLNYYPSEKFQLSIAYNGKAKYLRWLVNGVEVFRVNRLGYRLQGFGSDYLVLDLGGAEEDVFPESIQPGFGTFSLLDGFTPCTRNIKNGVLSSCPRSDNDKGLVLLVDSPNTYYFPGTQTVAEFLNDGTDPATRLFGQGSVFKVSSLLVQTRAAPRDTNTRYNTCSC